MRLLTDEELRDLERAPRERVRHALESGDRAEAKAVVSRATRAWQRGIDGFRAWIDHTVTFLAAAHGTDAAERSRDVVADAHARRVPWTTETSDPASDDPLLVELCTTENRLRAEHDAWLDAVCALLSHVYRTYGVDELEASIRDAGDRTLLAWMPRDIAQAPEDRIRTWTGMLQGNFATIRVEEDDEKFVITQDPCGSCGRQIASRGFPGSLDLAMVTEVHPITFDRGDVHVYRTHVAVMHFLMPRERLGVPWPVVACPPGDGVGPCRISLYKNPLDPSARGF